MIGFQIGPSGIPVLKLKNFPRSVQKFRKIPITKISHICIFTSIKLTDNAGVAMRSLEERIKTEQCMPVSKM